MKTTDSMYDPKPAGDELTARLEADRHVVAEMRVASGIDWPDTDDETVIRAYWAELERTASELFPYDQQAKVYVTTGHDVESWKRHAFWCAVEELETP